MCSETDGCLYWTWIRKSKNGRKVCKLKSGIINTGFGRQKNNAVSGTMLNGCNQTGGGSDNTNNVENK